MGKIVIPQRAWESQPTHYVVCVYCDMQYVGFSKRKKYRILILD